MAKRTRYPGRPGSPRPAGSRPTTGGGSASRPASSPRGGLTEAEIARAAEIEAELQARERAAIADNARRRARTRGAEIAGSAGVIADAGTPLSVRAAHEYAYVARDVKRIGLTAIVMFAILGALWVLVNIGGVGLP